MPTAGARGTRAWSDLVATVRQLARPPGCGWATSRAGEAVLAAEFHRRRYGTSELRGVSEQWLHDLTSDAVSSAGGGPVVGMLGVPFDQGSYGPSGAAAGPLGIREALVDQRSLPAGVVDLGDVPHLPGAPLDEMIAPVVLERVRRSRFGEGAARQPVAPLSIHRAIVEQAGAAGLRVLSLGGDHAVSASAILGLGRSTALVHFDAHDDLSTGRDGLTMLHSSWISFVDAVNPFPVVAQIGVQYDDDRSWLEPRLHRFDRGELAADPDGVAERVAQVVLDHGCTSAYVTVDIDVIRSTEAPATPLPNATGATVADVVSCIARLGLLIDVAGADVVEVAPPATAAGEWCHEPTCVSAAAIACSLIGAIRAQHAKEASR